MIVGVLKKVALFTIGEGVDKYSTTLEIYSQEQIIYVKLFYGVILTLFFLNLMEDFSHSNMVYLSVLAVLSVIRFIVFSQIAKNTQMKDWLNNQDSFYISASSSVSIWLTIGVYLKRLEPGFIILALVISVVNLGLCYVYLGTKEVRPSKFWILMYVIDTSIETYSVSSYTLGIPNAVLEEVIQTSFFFISNLYSNVRRKDSYKISYMHSVLYLVFTGVQLYIEELKYLSPNSLVCSYFSQILVFWIFYRVYKYLEYFSKRDKF